MHHATETIATEEDSEFVPKPDDFQLLKIIRPKAQGCKLQNPRKQHVTEREEHEGLQRNQTTNVSYASPSDSVRWDRSVAKSEFVHPSGVEQEVSPVQGSIGRHGER